MSVRFLSPLFAHDPRSRLPGTVRGTVRINTPPLVPAQRRVQLFTCGNAHGMAFPTNAVPVRWQWSGLDGTYRFDNLDPLQTYGVIAYDHTGTYDPEIKLNITPEVLP